MIAIVVAMDKNNAIGKDNKLLWHITEDLKYFKTLTSGSVVVMGRKTFESIGKPLPNRRNIVVSRSLTAIEGVEMVNSLESALDLVKSCEKVFIIGGGEIYRQSLNLVDRLYITLVDSEYQADTYFPPVDLSAWEISSTQHFDCGVAFPYPFSFIQYKRKSI